MRKLPSAFENPIDDLLLSLADFVCPLFRATGHTPNAITTYSCVAGAYALHSLKTGDFNNFALAWGLSYFFDCLDGHYARRYSMVTKFGDYFDHISDAVQGSIALLLVISLRPPLSLCVTLAIPMYLCLVHFGCQEQVYKASANYDGVSSATLSIYEGLCRQPSDIWWTRMFGAGTVHLIFIIVVWYLLPETNA